MSTTVTQDTSSSSNNSNSKEELPLPPEILQDEFELFLYLRDYIASYQCQFLKQQWRAEPSPGTHCNPPSTPAADGPQNEGTRKQQPSDPVLRLPGNPCRSLVLWRADRRVSLVSSSFSSSSFAKVWRNHKERERTKAFERYLMSLKSPGSGFGGRGVSNEPQQEEEHLEYEP